jgi:hypothetical protein
MRSRAVLLLLLVAFFASSSIASCGVMFGAEEENFCAQPQQSCTLASQCPITACLCDDGVARAVSFCVTEQSCCAKTSHLCKQMCEPNGGWSGQSDAGLGGTGGSAGRGGSGGTGGSAGTGGRGGASGAAGVNGRGGTSGSSGASGSGGSGGLPVVGQICTGTPLSVSCGCSSASDPECNQVLLCSATPTSSSRWVEGAVCDPGIRCFALSGRSIAACGTTARYLPYAQVGAVCASASGDTYACSLDLRSELFCEGGRWRVQETCASGCTTFPGGTPRCPSTTSFCVGCN